MIIKEALSPVPSKSPSLSDTTTQVFFRGDYAKYHGNMSDTRKSYSTLSEKYALKKSSVSRPSTASSLRSFSSSRVNNAEGGQSTSLSRPGTASTVRSSSSARVNYSRDRTVSPQRKEIQRQSRQVSRCSNITHRTSRSGTSQRPHTASIGRSATFRSTTSVPEDNYLPPQKVTSIDKLDKREWTSKDALMHLFDAWQPQLCSSYRPTVEYVPTGELQMRAFINVMLPGKHTSPYIEKFRAVGRVAETISHLSLSTPHPNVQDSVDHSIPEHGSNSSSPTYLQRNSSRDSFTSVHSQHDRHLPILNPDQRPKSSSYQPHGRRSMSTVHISGGSDRFSRLEKSKSHGHFNL